MSTSFPEMPRKLRWTKRQLVIGSVLFFLLVVAFCYALCRLEISRTEQEIFSAKNRFLLSKMDTMQQRLQLWRSDILDLVQNVRTSEAIRLFAQDMGTLPAGLLRAPEASWETLDEGQRSLLEQRDYMQRLLADMARNSSMERISLFLPEGTEIVDSAKGTAPSFAAQLAQGSMATRRTLFSSLVEDGENILLGVAAPLLELSSQEKPAVIGCAVLTFKMNTFLFTLLHDKEVLLELADISPLGETVFFVQDEALCVRPLSADIRAAQSQTFEKRAGLQADTEVYSIVHISHLPDSFLLEAAIPAGIIDDEISRKSLIVYLGAAIGCAGVALLLAFGVSFLAGRAHQAMAAHFKALYTLIRDQKQLLDSINASLHVGIVLFSPQGGIRLFTPEFARICAMLGHEQPDGAALDDIFPAEAARILREGIARKRRDASVEDVEISLPDQDGEQRLYRVSLYLFSGDEGGEARDDDALSVVAMFNDITQFRKKALQAKALQRNLMDALIRAVENVDPNLVGHSLKMEQVADVLGRHMGLAAPDVTTLHMAARLCQIGKIFVPHDLLQKSGKLTDEEQQAVLRSTEYAFNILKGIPFGLPVPEAVYDMNEKFDGSGPRGLKGMDINLHSRILAIVNAFCSMTSDRAYRSGMPIEQALDILGRSEAFDPAIVQTLRHVPQQELRAALERQENATQQA